MANMFYQPDAHLTITGPLGTFTFQDFEVPEEISFFGEYHYKLHQQPGGTRQYDMLGPNDGPIRWSGRALTSGEFGTADERMNALANMWEAGDRCILEFGIWSFAVIISKFEIKYRAKNFCEYEIELMRIINANELPDALAPTPPADLGAVQTIINQQAQ